MGRMSLIRPLYHHMGAPLRAYLGERAIVIESRHRREVLGLQIRRVGRRDQAVGVGRVADDNALDCEGGGRG
jgi:hypothetical protein